MTTEIVFSKITPPKLPHSAVDRPEAISELVRCLSWRIVVVVAPVGSAKSGLLAEGQRKLAQKAGRWRTAWLTVDGNDDAERLFAHAHAALSTMFSDLDQDGFPEMLGTDRNKALALLGNYFHDVVKNDTDLDYVLFVDDLSYAPRSVVSEFLNAFVEYFPANFHVVASGSNQLWDCLKIRYRDEVCEYPAEKLKFSVEETRNLLDLVFSKRGTAQYEPADLDALADNLRASTGGWVYGIRVYADAVSWGSIEFSPEVDEQALCRLLGSFFRERVLDTLPADIADFVIVTGVPDSVNAELCNVLTERQDSKAVLRDLNLENCFITECPGRPGWYAYHPLFRRWLHRKAGQFEARRLRGICNDASTWSAQHDSPNRAAKYLLMVCDSEFIEELSAAVGFASGRVGMGYFDWIGQTPAEAFSRDPGFALQAVWGYIFNGDVGHAENWVETFEECCRSGASAGEVDAERALLLVRAKCLELECCYPKSIELVERYLETYGTDLTNSQQCLLMQSLGESYIRTGRLDDAFKNLLQAEVLADLSGSSFFVALCNMNMLWADIYRGSFSDALSIAQDALENCSRESATFGALLAEQGYILIEMGRYEEAKTCIEQAKEALQLVGNVDMYYECQAIHAYLMSVTGQQSSAFRTITKLAFSIGDRCIARSVNLFILLIQGRIALGMGYLSEARAACDKLVAGTAPEDLVYKFAAEGLSSLIDEANGVSRPAVEILDDLDVAEQRGIGLCEITLCISASLRFAREGKRSDALVYMGRALHIQAGQGIVGPFLRAGDAARSILYEIVDIRKSGGQVRRLAKRMLAAFGESDAADSSSSSTANPLSRFGLTEREIEVMELLDNGLSRREIADRLSVSLNTVKSHMSNIYNKLGVTNRVDAFDIVHGVENRGRTGR